MDIINEFFIFIGLGVSTLIHFELSMLLFIVYLMLTVNVSINAHLKKEFKLTYAKLGPTEFRVVAILVNTLYIYSAMPCTQFHTCLFLTVERKLS